MAHEKINGICSEKCQVDITDKLIKGRFEFPIDRIPAYSVNSYTLNPKYHGINIPDGVTFGVLLTEKTLKGKVGINGNSEIKIQYYVTYYSTGGEICVDIINNSKVEYTDIKFDVVII